MIRSKMTPLQYAEQIAYSSKETLRFSYDMALKYKDVDAVMVECGCAAGAQIIAMASAAPDKIIYAFDSFEGIPLPSNRDNQMPGIKMLSDWEQNALPGPGEQELISSGATIVPYDNFWCHIANAFDKPIFSMDSNPPILSVPGINVTTVQGWFEYTVPMFAKKCIDISILRLDGDLYNSTFVCLQHLFPLVINGGCVIIDDWTLPGCQDACKEYFQLIGYEPDYQFLSTISHFYK